MENSEIEEKQTYLREQVLDVGYNAEDFLNFLISKKGEHAADLDTWKFDELKSVVGEFKSIKNKKIEKIEKIENIEEIPKEKSKESEVNIEVKPYEEIISCIKQEKSPLFDCNNVKVVLSDPEKHEEGIFKSNYFTYLVTTQVINAKVKRRYSDFAWLKEILGNTYHGIFIPPIPKKKFMEKTNEILVHKRMRYLQKFIDSLLKCKSIKSSRILYDFLTIENKEEFINAKNKYSKIPIATTINDFVNLDGIINIKLNFGDEFVANKLNRSIQANDSLLKKLNENIKGLMSDLETVGSRIKEISSTFAQLTQCSQLSEDHSDVVNSYQMLTNLTSNWGSSYEKQINVINVELREFFDYLRKENMSFRNLIEEYEEAKVVYTNHENRLTNRKEDLFYSGNITRWELAQEDYERYDRSELISNKDLAFSKMLPKETNYVASLKRNFAYHLSTMINEYKRMQKNHGKMFKHHFLNLSTKNTSLLSDIFNVVKLLTCSW